MLKNTNIPYSLLKAVQTVIKPKNKGDLGQRWATALQELGPTFIKFGQALSTRSDLLGEKIAKDLSVLRDDLPPFNEIEVRNIIEKELETKIEECFSDFSWKPIAAASIAQVHFAITADGEKVAVKVLRPNIEKAFAEDLMLFHWLAQIFERLHPELRRLKPIEIVKTFEETIRLEMDLRLEAAAAQELAENFSEDQYFRVPKVDWQRTSRRVLTIERVSGIAIDQRETIIQAGHDPNKILTRAATALFKQVFRDGFFHADQHPGNLFVGENGEIIAVDFGIMGRLDIETRRYLAEMLIGFLNRDYSKVAELHFTAGYVPAEKSVLAFTQACRSIAEPILDKPQNEISIARLLAHLFQITNTFSMETQPQLLLLQKTMLTAEGVGRTLSPTANMWFLAQPLIKDWIDDNLGTETIVANTINEITNTLQRLPTTIANIEKNTATIAKDGLKLDTNNLHDISFGNEEQKIPLSIIYILVTLFLIGFWLIS